MTDFYEDDDPALTEDEILNLEGTIPTISELFNIEYTTLWRIIKQHEISPYRVENGKNIYVYIDLKDHIEKYEERKKRRKSKNRPTVRKAMEEIEQLKTTVEIIQKDISDIKKVIKRYIIDKKS